MAFRFVLAGVLLIAIAAIGGTRGLAGGAVSSESDSRVLQAISMLEKVPSGQGVLERARRRWNKKASAELVSLFQWSTVSKTDAVLSRHFDPLTGEESRDRKVMIYLREDQSVDDLVLDVAHELTHATAGPSWDPYDPQLTPGKYVLATIEGEGGEVDALIAECRVGLGLGIDRGLSASRCRRYLSATKIEKERVLRDFYRVGKWRGEIARKLGREGARFPWLSDDAPQLYSSTGHAPYPLALIREYEEITGVACENSLRRLRSLDQDRSPASLRRSTRDFLDQRCRGAGT